MGFGGVIAAVLARKTPGLGETNTEGGTDAQAPVTQNARSRQVIINADDFGMSAEIDRGILDAHDRGVVTSASLMVDEPDAEAAVEQARQRPGLSLGIHVAFDRRGQWFVDIGNLAAVQRELDHQLGRFVRLTGRTPTHIDSHHHVHRSFNVARLFLEVGERYGVPVRGFSEVFYIGQFYGQLEFRKTDLSLITVETFTSILRSLRPGVTEVSCHPGHLEMRPDAFYNREREVELQVLTDRRVKAAIADARLHRISYLDYPRFASRPGRGLLAGCPPAPTALRR
ncbi:MAG TPA: ChbG/HpnK family deacetylase [Candidatus Nitrosotalea sp.]|nr:ChbG/HpnK family deacetylase [Candidatus Nitrosotalea sp.]